MQMIRTHRVVREWWQMNGHQEFYIRRLCFESVYGKHVLCWSSSVGELADHRESLPGMPQIRYSVCSAGSVRDLVNNFCM